MEVAKTGRGKTKNSRASGSFRWGYWTRTQLVERAAGSPSVATQGPQANPYTDAVRRYAAGCPLMPQRFLNLSARATSCSWASRAHS
jgi:hypothetical protein